MTDTTDHRADKLRRILSIVLPAYNEAGNIDLIHQALVQALASSGLDLDIIFVDDGSSDHTARVTLALAQRDPRVRLLSLTRNFGHQAALLAGLEVARGDAIITMDCDMQHPPDLLPAMIAEWRNGALVVQTVRQETMEIGPVKRLTSDFFYRVMSFLSATKLTSGAADFKLYDRRALDQLLQFQDYHLFIRGMTAWMGFRTAEIPYRAAARAHGVSSYSLRRMIALATDAITAFSTAPLRTAFYTGCVSAILALVYLVYIAFNLFTGRVVEGWVSLMVVLLFLGTAQLITLGVIGEYIGRIYHQTLRRPRYVVAPTESTPAPHSGKSAIVEGAASARTEQIAISVKG